MLPPSESTKSNDRLSRSSNGSINSLYHQICKVSKLRNELQIADQSLQGHLQETKITAYSIIDQFHAQKKDILNRFDDRLAPFVEEILGDLLLEVDQLKKQLEYKLDNLDRVTEDDLREQALYWVDWYSKWNDRNALIEKVLKVVVDRTTHLVDKDIQIIQDYQTQSLSNINQEFDSFRSVEKRLGQAIEGPLRQLTNLKMQAKEHTSLQQVSEWVAKLQERREGYFDQLLMRIDHVMKDVVQLEETNDLSLFVEIEGEIVFMEKELQQINDKILYINLIDGDDRLFLYAQLEGVLEHATEVENHLLPCSLHERISAIKLRAEAAMALVGSD